jgi:SAM-dependent methyltransferase
MPGRPGPVREYASSSPPGSAGPARPRRKSEAGLDRGGRLCPIDSAGVSSDVGDLQRSWEALGREDPLWAVLTDPGKRGGGWAPEEFLASGEYEIARVFGRLAQFGVEVPDSGRALDFGCGAGRLTQALGARCAHVDGVDIASSMLEAAERLNSTTNVHFHHNVATDLAMFEPDTFDLVYSSIVLQHMPPVLALGYLAEFVRVLKPGGVLVFQAQERHLAERNSIGDRVAHVRCALAVGTRLTQRRLRIERPDPPWEMEMHTLASRPCRVLDTAYTNTVSADFNGQLRYLERPPERGWVSRQWTAIKL